MNDFNSDDRIDLGDAVVETKGSAMIGTADPLSGLRLSTGFSSED